ncbi:MAG: hypothetical protein ACI9JM_001571 [Halioglobus sp.]|jgi:hypothetical protein
MAIAKIASVLLFVVGIINVLPLVGILSGEKLSQMYSVDLVGNDLVILMRHRALLFGIVGGFILYSVFVPVHRGAAMVMAAFSMIGYGLLLWQEGGYNASLYKVLLVDVVGVLCLLGAASLKYLVGPNT